MLDDLGEYDQTVPDLYKVLALQTHDEGLGNLIMPLVTHVSKTDHTLFSRDTFLLLLPEVLKVHGVVVGAVSGGLVGDAELGDEARVARALALKQAPDDEDYKNSEHYFLLQQKL